jgi:hypothetical protein
MFLVAMACWVGGEANAEAALQMNTDQPRTMRYAPSYTVPTKYLRFMELGRQAQLSDQQIRELVADFEGGLKTTYGALGQQLLPVLDKEALTDNDRELISDRTRVAAEQIVDSTRKLLQPFQFSGNDLAELVPKYHYFDHATNVAMKGMLSAESLATLPAEILDERDNVLMPHSVPFAYFMAGLSRRVGIYMDIGSDKRLIGGSFLIDFPGYYFGRDGVSHDMPLRDDVQRFLTRESMRDVTNKLYDANVTAVSEVILPNISSYTLNGVATNYSTYGLNDSYEPAGKILIYEGNIGYRARTKPDEWRRNFQNSVEIHEIMHTLHRRRYQSCTVMAGRRPVVLDSVSLSLQDLDEVQAQIATFAVLAEERHASLHTIVALGLTLYLGKQRELINNAFYNGLFQKISPGQFKAVSDLDRLTQAAKVALLFDATPQDISDMARVALGKILEGEIQVCH